MTAEVPSNHIVHLLPAYLNKTLDLESTEYVQHHLLLCETCQRELAAWEAVRNVTQFMASAAPLPSVNVMNQVWATIDMPVQKPAWSLSRMSLHLWLVFKKQAPLLHKSIWFGSPFALILGCIITLLYSGHPQNSDWVLSLFSTVVAATGAGFIYGAEHDPGFEMTLSTPTSIRIVMLCRLLLVVGYNFLLSACASALVTFAHGGGFWEIIQLWLGPMLLLSSLTLALTLITGSWLAILASLLIEVSQGLLIHLDQHLPVLQLVNPGMWQTTPMILLLTVLFVVLALFYAPRQPRLAS